MYQSVDGKALGKRAYQLAVDRYIERNFSSLSVLFTCVHVSYRIPLCLEHPAHTIAAGCIYLASILLKEEDESFQGLSEDQAWDQFFCSRMIDIEGKHTERQHSIILVH